MLSAKAPRTMPSDSLRLSDSQACCIGSTPICPTEWIPGTSLLFFTGCPSDKRWSCPFPQASWLFGFSSCLDFLNTFISGLLRFHRDHLFRNKVSQLSSSRVRLQTERCRKKLDNYLICIDAPNRETGHCPINRKKISMKTFLVVFIPITFGFVCVHFLMRIKFCLPA